MRTYERTRDRATRRARRFLASFGEELRRLRRRAGLSQKALARSAGTSQPQVARVEAGKLQSLSILRAAELLAVVGGDLSVRVYPGALHIHDAGQLKLLERLRARLSPTLIVRTEVRLDIRGDQRAFDVLATGPGVRAAFELVARMEDTQAVERAMNLKLRDGDVPCLILVLADSRHNRAAAAGAPILRAAFPASPRAVLAALAAGRQPIGSAIVFL